MRTRTVAGNWKLNGTRDSAASLAGAIATGAGDLDAAVRVIVCPTFVHLGEAGAALRGSRVALGAQDAADQHEGAFTGEVSAAMLGEYGCEYVIVGHSERRHVYGESDLLSVRKYAAVRAAGLTPILCVGETLAEREAGQTEAVVARQLDAVRAELGADCFDAAIIAYEPVWAIGTGRTATPGQAQAVHAFIGAGLPARDAVTLLYGGSVNAANAAELFAMEDIDGGLIGGASLRADEFLNICRACGPS